MPESRLVEKAYRDIELTTEWREHIIALSAAHQALYEALSRLLSSYQSLLSQKPVRDVEETIGEAHAALALADAAQEGEAK